MDCDTKECLHKIETQQQQLCVFKDSKQDSYQGVKCEVAANFNNLGSAVPEFKTTETRIIKVEFTEDDLKRSQESCKVEDNPQSPNKSEIKAFVLTANPLKSLLYNERQRQKINTSDSTLCTSSSPVTTESADAVQERYSKSVRSLPVGERCIEPKQQPPSDVVPSAAIRNGHDMQVETPRSETKHILTRSRNKIWTEVQGDEASSSKHDTAKQDRTLNAKELEDNVSEPESMVVSIATDRSTERDIPELSTSSSSANVTRTIIIPLGPKRAEDGKLPCMYCSNVSFDGMRSWKQHQKQIHPEKRAFLCIICEKEFMKKHHLRNHVKYVHTDEKRKYDKTPVTCQICGKVYTKISIRPHMLTHQKDARFKCSQCDKAFQQVVYLRRHEETHANRNNYNCDFCGYGCKTKRSLTEHLRQHKNENSFKCQHCPKTFSKRSKLKNHMESHNKSRRFVCSECDARFGFKGDLDRHMRSHTGEKPYSCLDCGASFALKDTLKNHQRTHTKEKPYLCNECGKAFGQNSSYRQHLKTHGVELNTDTRVRLECRYCGKEFGNTGAYRQHVRAHKKKV